MTKKERIIINNISQELKKKFQNNESSHDWYHLKRTWQAARFIGQREKADMFIVELAALLHDIADAKFHDGDHSIGPKKALYILKKHRVEENLAKKISRIVGNVSFSKTGRRKNMKTLEGKVVQDADRLDAAGAISIARTFAYGGFRNRLIYNPSIKPYKKMSIAQANKGASSLHYFYEKLLHVQDLMNTKTGRRIAKKRHKILVQYLNQFHIEWTGLDLK